MLGLPLETRASTDMDVESKGILKPSRFTAPDATEQAAAASPADEGDATPSATQTTHYAAFHGRVADVFANLGPGLAGCGSEPTPGTDAKATSQSPGQGAVWMPTNTSVTRRGARDDYSDDDDDDDDDDERIGRGTKRNRNDDSSGDDDRGSRSGDSSEDEDEDDRPTFDHTASNAEVSEVRRQRQKARWADDLDCLESDEDDDDDQKKMAKLGRSVGRCSALNDEEEFDYYDTLAMTGMNRAQPLDGNGEGGIDVARIQRLVDGHDDFLPTDEINEVHTEVLPSNAYERRILAREGKSAPDDVDETEDVVPEKTADGSRGKRGGFAGAYVPPSKRAKGTPGAAPARGVAWDASVPEVTRPRYGDGGRGRGRGGGRGRGRGRGVPDHVKNPHKYKCYVLDEPLVVGGGVGGGGGVNEMEAARRAASAAAASKGPAASERSLPAAPIEKPVFQLSAAAAARRDARRGDKKVTGGGGGGGGGVRIDFAHGDEDEDGGGEDGNRSGFGGGGKRARNFRKKSAEDD